MEKRDEKPRTQEVKKKPTAAAGKKSGPAKQSATPQKRAAAAKNGSARKKPGRASSTQKRTDISHDKTARNLAALERDLKRKKKKKAVQTARIKTTAALFAAFLGASLVLLLVKVTFFPTADATPPPLPVAQNEKEPINAEEPRDTERTARKPEPRVPQEQEPERTRPAQPQRQQPALSEQREESAEDPHPLEERQSPEETPAAAEQPAESERPTERHTGTYPIPSGSGMVCFVFDDAGHNVAQLEPFLDLPFPCTVAVLPGLPHSTECADKIRKAGKELILHQPMQALNADMDPGPSAILPGMGKKEIYAVVEKNIEEVGPIVGLNNHEGSLITADKTAMEAVFDVIEARSLFFLDSRTNARTTAPEIARERGVKIWERAVFLDNNPQKEEIEKAVVSGLRIAAEKGHAIMIGHIWSDELAGLLFNLYPELIQAGYTLCDISDLQSKTETGGNNQ